MSCSAVVSKLSSNQPPRAGRLSGAFKLGPSPRLSGTHDDEVAVCPISEQLFVVLRALERDHQVGGLPPTGNRNHLGMWKIASVRRLENAEQLHRQVVNTVLAINPVACEKIPASTDLLENGALGLVPRKISPDFAQPVQRPSPITAGERGVEIEAAGRILIGAFDEA